MIRALLLTTVLALAAAAPAGAVVVVQRSIAGVRLDTTAAQVRAVLGKPGAVSHPTDAVLGRVTRYRYGLTDVYLSRGTHGRVYDVTTRSRHQRTANGAGVGSSAATVRARVKHVRCSSFKGFRRCAVGKALPGHTVTTFFLGRGSRVTSVSLGHVLD